MESSQYESAIFGAGCFWGVEAAFRATKGVFDTEVGYSGGRTDHPTYKEVCYNDTGHAEVVRVVFDPSQISYRDLVDLFWKIHDPTQLNRQGPDVGDQYRTVIFFQNAEQEVEANASKEAAAKQFSKPIATQIQAAGTFWKAEDYHQQYLEKRGLASCHIST